MEIGDPLSVRAPSTYTIGPDGGFEVAAVYRPLRVVRPGREEVAAVVGDTSTGQP